MGRHTERTRRMMTLLAVMAGGGLGAGLRYGVNNAAARLLGVNFPYGILAINILGSLAMGLLVGLFAAREPVSPLLKTFLTTGILGGFTTFSAFSLDAVTLFERGATGAAVLYVVLSVVLSVFGCWAGLMLARGMA